MAIKIIVPKVESRPMGQSKYHGGATAAAFGGGDAAAMADMGNGLLSASGSMMSTATKQKNEQEAEQKRLENERKAAAKKAQGQAEKFANKQAAYSKAAWESSMAVSDVEKLFNSSLDLDIGEAESESGDVGLPLSMGYVDSDYAIAGSGYTADSGEGETELDRLNRRFAFDGYNPNDESEKIRAVFAEDMQRIKEKLASSGMKDTDKLKKLKSRADEWARAIKSHNNKLRKRETATHLSNINNSYATAENQFKEALGRINTDGGEDLRNILENMVDLKKSELFLNGSLNSVDKNGNPTDVDALARRSSSEYVESVIADHIKKGDIVGANKIFGFSADQLDDAAKHDITLSLDEELRKLQGERVIKSIGNDMYMALSSGDQKLKKKAMDDYGLQGLEAQSKIDAYVDRLQEADKEEIARVDTAAEEHFQNNLREGRVPVKYDDKQTGQTVYYDRKKMKEAGDLLYKIKTNTHSAEGDEVFTTVNSLKGDPERMAKVDLNHSSLKYLTQDQWDTVNKEVTAARQTVRKLNDEAVSFYTAEANKSTLDTVFTTAEILPEGRSEIVKEAIADIRANGTGAVDLPSVKLWVQQEYVHTIPYKVTELRKKQDKESYEAGLGIDERESTSVRVPLNGKLSRHKIEEYRNAHVEGKKGAYVEDEDIKKKLVSDLERRGLTTNEFNIKFNPEDGSYSYTTPTGKVIEATWKKDSSGKPVFTHKPK